MTQNFLNHTCRKTFFIISLFFISCTLAAQQSDPAEFFNTLYTARKLTADKKWNDAVPLWEQLAEQNFVNGEYVANLASAYYNTKQYSKSIEAYKKQIELGYGLVYNAIYNIACCYSLMGDRENALQWLQKAFDAGFRSYENAQKDEDFGNIKSDPRFLKIVALDDVSRMTREEGWKYDMDMLKREVMRKAFFRRELNLDEFNRRYDALYNSIDKKTDVLVIMDLMKLMVQVGDGHTGIFAPSRKEFQTTLPLQFYSFKEGWYIVASDEKNKNLLGAKLLGFDGRSINEITKRVEPYLQRDNEMNLLNNLTGALRYTIASNALGLTKDPVKVELQLEDGAGKKFNATVNSDETTPRVDHKSVPANWTSFYQANGKPIPLYLKDPKSRYWYEVVPGTKTLYLQWNNVRNDNNETLAQFTDRLFRYINENNIEKLVIDLRWNNGGNTSLLPYFITSVIKNDKINQRGNLFVITGRRTFSAAQNLATFLERQTNAIFIGEPTGSNPNFVGEESFIVLPYSKLAMNVSDLFWQSSWPGDKRTWIAPAIYVPPTFKAYSENRDEAMEAILKLINAKKSF